jgi:hypothetical protein
MLIIAEKVMLLKGFSDNGAPLSDEHIELLSTLNKGVWPLSRVKPILQFISANAEWFKYILEE